MAGGSGWGRRPRSGLRRGSGPRHVGRMAQCGAWVPGLPDGGHATLLRESSPPRHRDGVVGACRPPWPEPPSTPDEARARGETVPGGRCLPDRGCGPGAGRSSDSRARIRRSTYCPSLPRPSAQCLLTEVVPEHRCGAVPDSHRVPSCLSTVEVDGGEPVRGRLYVTRGWPCVMPACREVPLSCDAR